MKATNAKQMVLAALFESWKEFDGEDGAANVDALARYYDRERMWDKSDIEDNVPHAEDDDEYDGVYA